MEVIRKSYQGVTNIIRFNWHFYVAATVLVFILLFASFQWDSLMSWICTLLAAGIVTSTFISIFVSHYVYDRSGLYNFNWLNQFKRLKTPNMVNVHAGFDETSGILQNNFPEADLQVFDFYDPRRHTEVSIERARKAYPPFHGTVKIATNEFPVSDKSLDIIFNIFALHEVRDRNERIQFLDQQAVALKNAGRIIVVEHLRDLPNFLAYNVGFFHFFSAQEWDNNFQQSGLCVDHKFKITPFIVVFILKKVNGSTP